MFIRKIEKAGGTKGRRNGFFFSQLPKNGVLCKLVGYFLLNCKHLFASEGGAA